jgi:hypothetical protein
VSADDSQNMMAQAMMGIRGLLEPAHEFLLGEIRYFEGQGFSADQAREMAFLEFRLAFGSKPPTEDQS